MVPAFTGQPLTAIEPQGFEKRARASMTGPWARLIGFGSRGYWICEKLQTAFPTPEPGHGFKETGLRSLEPGEKAGTRISIINFRYSKPRQTAETHIKTVLTNLAT